MINVVIKYEFKDIEFKENDRVKLKLYRDSAKIYTKDAQVEFEGEISELKQDKFDIAYNDGKYLTIYIEDVESMEKLKKE